MKEKASRDLRTVRDKTLGELVGPLPPPEFDSHLVHEVHRLWQVPLKRFRLGDLRLLIGQTRGLPYLVPIALEHLENHALAEGTYYPGDLLAMVAAVPDEFWTDRPELRGQFKSALQRALARVHKKDVPEEVEGEFLSALRRLG